MDFMKIKNNTLGYNGARSTVGDPFLLRKNK